MVVDIFNTENVYDIIYADPPWEYRQSGSKKKSRGMAKQHYCTMSTNEICKLPVRRISKNDAVLFIWATFPNIKEALTVIEQWGFKYVTAAFVWAKKNKRSGNNFWGMGAYTRANAEVCLLAISRETHASKIVKKHNVHQIVESPVEEHSKKPDEVRNRILELLGPDNKRIELFARKQVDGWDCWGDKV